MTGANVRTTELYGKLTQVQQDTLGKQMTEKLKTLIGGYGELSVLAEYIQVMLQSSRPKEQIETELEAFLQDQSRPFTNWLCQTLAELAGEGAREKEGGRRKSGEKADKAEKARHSERKREKRAAAAAAQQAAAAAADRRSPEPTKRAKTEGAARSRSRPRRRAQRAAAVAAAKTEPAATVASPRRARRAAEEVDKKPAVLTPNSHFLRDSYHHKAEADSTPDARWHFRAEAPAAPVAYGEPPHQQMRPGVPPPRPMTPVYGAEIAGAPVVSGPIVTSVRPRHFNPKKWKVVREGTVVRATESLTSPEIQSLREGEIVEQTAPHFTLSSGIVRIQIRHPSSPQFPNPIGWVTLDATRAGGPKFLEAGPEPMIKPQEKGEKGKGKGKIDPYYMMGGFNPYDYTPYYPYPDPAKGKAKGKEKGGGKAPGAPGSFTNLTWTPGKTVAT